MLPFSCDENVPHQASYTIFFKQPSRSEVNRMGTVRDSDSALKRQHESGSVSHHLSAQNQDSGRAATLASGSTPACSLGPAVPSPPAPHGPSGRAVLSLTTEKASPRSRHSDQPRQNPLLAAKRPWADFCGFSKRPQEQQVPRLLQWLWKGRELSLRPAPHPAAPWRPGEEGWRLDTAAFSHHLGYMFKEQKQQDHNLDN